MTSRKCAGFSGLGKLSAQAGQTSAPQALRQSGRVARDLVRENVEPHVIAGAERWGGAEWSCLVVEGEGLRELEGEGQGGHGGWLLGSGRQQFDASILLDAPAVLDELPLRDQFLD